MSVDHLEPRALEEIFTKSLNTPSPREGSLDPSEHFEFSRPPKGQIHRFDTRSDSEIAEVALHHDSSLERERALWEYADRHESAAMPLLRQAAQHDTDAAVRCSTLWALQKFAGAPAANVIAASLIDDHPEVADWAALLTRECTSVDVQPRQKRAFRYDPTNPFDQTLPLMIAGYARVRVAGVGSIQATLSPQWFEAIMGRVMACTRRETFDTDLVIEKCIYGYHPDRSNHYETYMFRGFTTHLAEGVAYHQYEGRGEHTFYPSGKVEEITQEPLTGVMVNMARCAVTITIGDPDRDRQRIVQSVRGRYMGAAYVNTARVFENNMTLGPGMVQLSDWAHPIAGPLTNTFLFGTFRGKLSDLNHDGLLDVNTEPCHATFTGQPDFDLDGKADGDPFDPRRRR